jgi:hypothetical protein
LTDCKQFKCPPNSIRQTAITQNEHNSSQTQFQADDKILGFRKWAAYSAFSGVHSPTKHHIALTVPI